MIKKCGRCKINKNTSEFHKNKCTSDGFSGTCKECRTVTTKIYYETYKEERLEYAKKAYERDPEKFAKKNKKYIDDDPERKVRNNKKGHIKWYSREENRKKKSEYHQDRIEEHREYHKNYVPRREKEDINFKLINRLRTRMNTALKKGYKSGSAVKDLGCSIEFFKQHLESLWSQGMSWNNYGKGNGKWNIDHKIPLSLFDLTNREQFLKACHYTNQQPMWHPDNVRKSNKVQ